MFGGGGIGNDRGCKLGGLFTACCGGFVDCVASISSIDDILYCREYKDTQTGKDRKDGHFGDTDITPIGHYYGLIIAITGYYRLLSLRNVR